MARSFDNIERRDTAPRSDGDWNLSLLVFALSVAVALGIFFLEQEEEKQPINPVQFKELVHVTPANDKGPTLQGTIDPGDLVVRVSLTPAGKHVMATRYSPDFYRKIMEAVDSGPLPGIGQRDALGEKLEVYWDFAKKSQMIDDERQLSELRDKWTARKNRTTPRSPAPRID